jgi:thioredoxin 1
MSRELNTQNFEELVLKSEKPVMVDFWAEWCSPCRMIAPMVEEIAKDFDGRADVLKCDIDENHQLAEKFGIRNIPTMLYFKNGKVVDKHVGSGMKKALTEKLLPLLA